MSKSFLISLIIRHQQSGVFGCKWISEGGEGRISGNASKIWYHLTITNLETFGMFSDMFAGWFDNHNANYNAFIDKILTWKSKRDECIYE